MLDRRPVHRLLDAFEDAADEAALKSRELIRILLEHGEEPFSRGHFTPGHITATGVVLHPSRDAVLLVHHRRLDRWLLPGGHVEPDDGEVWRSARREVIEETGAVLKANGAAPLVGMDVHGIPPRKKEPLHLHHDLIFGFRATAEQFTCSEESREVLWCGFDEFARFGLPESITRSIARCGRLL
jgi:8-oxo-dGTP pyrophosphatase MutT (NUDIX family)